MSEIKKAKHKLKKYYMKKNVNKRGLDIGLKGFLCSCNNREKECIRESYNLLNSYADKMYNNEVNNEHCEDIEKALSQEISNLKQEDNSEKRFQLADTGAKNFLFIRTSLDNPVEIATKIVEDIFNTKTQQTRFLLRLVPIETTCKAHLSDIMNAFEPLCLKYFTESQKSFSVVYNHRYNDTLCRDDIIKGVADRVFRTGLEHKVNLKGAEVSIIIEVVKGFALLSVVPHFIKYKKYNLLALCAETTLNKTTN